jgi:dihydroorotase
VIEHVTTRDVIAALADFPPTVGATVTAHHLLLTLDDVIGAELHPHNFCKPVAKRPADREALVDAVLSGRPRIFFGSDSAPHPRSAKESACGCAGVYSAPVAIPLLAELFEQAGAPLTEAAAEGRANSLEAFVSRAGAEFYRLPLNERTITLVESDRVIPQSYAGVVPFRAGGRLRYDLAGEATDES